MMILQHRFVELVPDVLEEGILYISIENCSAIHKCVCGCGNEVVTPLSPADWEFSFDGKNVSLYPSIGNWNFKCKSHYWITKSRVRFARKWKQWEIDVGREEDSAAQREVLQKKHQRRE